MRKIIMSAAVILTILPAASPGASQAESLDCIAQQIFTNECAAQKDRLISWNEGETFASLGIGHFIWYPPGGDLIYKESFPSFIQFAQNQGVELPEVLKNTEDAPWESRSHFLASKKSDDFKKILDFLDRTKSLQAEFILGRIEVFKEQLSAHKEGRRLIALTEEVGRSFGGKYALIDYLNFKGDGLDPAESYAGYGWGLKQVLLGMRESDDKIASFTESAKAVLRRRVELSPPQRHEKRWIKGWENRIDTYQNFGCNEKITLQ